MPDDASAAIDLIVDGRALRVPDDGRTLLDVLRGAGADSVKDGCAPQGQCGCCTVLVDGSPRVACVTPVRRVRGRAITTVDGIDPERCDRWAAAFAATGGSQCGFCTPGIICRLEGLAARGGDLTDDDAVGRSLQAHLCRCTGWVTIREAARIVARDESAPALERDLDRAARRAELEGGAPQLVGPHIALGRGGFADDIAPADALVAVPDGDGWALGSSVHEARARTAKVQGRRTSLAARPPVAVPAGSWAVTLATCWVEPAYLEPDAAWCAPGGDPVGPLLNGGAFGGKVDSPVAEVARRLADEHGRTVRVVTDREWVVRNGPKRPPLALGLRDDGSGVVHVARTPGFGDSLRRGGIDDVDVVEIDVAGPPTSTRFRAVGWGEVVIARAGLRGWVDEVVAPGGGAARAEVTDKGVAVAVRAGDPLDETVLRSYVVGAAHMALGWIRSEAIAVDDEGEVHDLTMRSFGVLRAVDTPRIDVEIDRAPGVAVNASEAVFVAVAAAAWLHAGAPTVLPSTAG